MAYTRTNARAKLIATVVSVGAVAAVAVVQSIAIGQSTGAPAQVVDYEPPIRNESYTVTHFGRSSSERDDRTTKAEFRVVERTGNCCENYLTISPEGRLFDLGGAYISFTDDDGKTWKQVRTIQPLVNGEGAITTAPNGDIVGIEWDPYSGDHLMAYKYDAKAEQWQYLESPIHTPFYDRPWLSLAPGPFTIRGEKVPYVTFVDGFPHRGAYLYSTDGLTYIESRNPFLERRLRGEIKGWIKTKPDPSLDWVLPNSESPITPLGGGSALAQPGLFADSWSVFDPKDQQWSTLRTPGNSNFQGRLLVDSRGRLHNLLPAGEGFEYRISTTGGRSWTSLMVDLPAGMTTGGFAATDFRVNAKLGIAAVAIHADAGETDQDLVYKLDISANKARVVSLYEIGLGDIDASAGVGQDIRMDFQSIAIFPDGRIAVSFLDSTTGPVFHLQEPINPDRLGPALAIEI